MIGILIINIIIIGSNLVDHVPSWLTSFADISIPPANATTQSTDTGSTPVQYFDVDDFKLDRNESNSPLPPLEKTLPYLAISSKVS